MSTTTKKLSTGIVTILIVAAMFLTVFAVLSLQEESYVYGTGETAKVTASSLNVRSGAGTKYSKLGALKKNKTFIVKGTSKDKSGVKWYKLKYGSKNGYVSSKYVYIKSNTVTSVSNTKGTVNTKKDPLTVRKGAGSSYAKLGSLAKGKTFNITGKIKDTSGVLWYRLTYINKTGYVSSKYVKTSSTTTTSSSSSSTSKAVTFKLGTVKTSGSSLNVRKGAGTSYTKLGTISNGSSIIVTGSAKASNGKVWYKYQFSSKTAGYVCSDYLTVKSVTSDSSFETYMTSQGFPASYKNGLRLLHATHPKWTFKALKLNINWSDALTAETKNPGTNLVSPSSPKSYRSTVSGAYNSKTKKWTTFDGGWYPASKTVVAYYMDPRNFLTNDGVYQFMTHSYDSSNQSATTVNAVIKGTFMYGKTPKGSSDNYAKIINKAGKNAKVNPNVLAAMIIQEQGSSGTSPLISGTYSGYKGYYNFLNVGAYTTSSHSKIVNGLIYAKNAKWDSVYDSIKGGASFYYNNYVSKKQNTYYLKKFNVYNGKSKVGTHQYMTNVQGAAGEGSLVRKAFGSDSSSSLTFLIPVYNSMPSSACAM